MTEQLQIPELPYDTTLARKIIEAAGEKYKTRSPKTRWKNRHEDFRKNCQELWKMLYETAGL